MKAEAWKPQIGQLRALGRKGKGMIVGGNKKKRRLRKKLRQQSQVFGCKQGFERKKKMGKK